MGNKASCFDEVGELFWWNRRSCFDEMVNGGSSFEEWGVRETVLVKWGMREVV